MATIALSAFTSSSHQTEYRLKFIEKVENAEQWKLGAAGNEGVAVIGHTQKSKQTKFINDLKSDFVGTLNRLKKKSSIMLPTTSGAEVSLSKLWREELKGTRGSAGGAGVEKKDVEVLSEAMFCFYFAIYLNKKQKKYSPIEWEAISTTQEARALLMKYGLTFNCGRMLVDPEFTSRISKVKIFLNQKGWHDRLVMQLDAFFAKYSFSGSNWFAMRTDVIPSQYNPYLLYNACANKAKTAFDFKTATDSNKWNPADIWIFNPRSIAGLKKFLVKTNQLNSLTPDYVVGYLNAVNNYISAQYKQKNLYPVSLKAPAATVHISEENYRGSSFYKVVHYKHVIFTNGNQDAKIQFSVDIVDKLTNQITKRNYMVGNIKTKTAENGGARLEIEVVSGGGGGARYGSAGTENYSWIINQTDSSGVRKLTQLRNQQTAIKEHFPTGKIWAGGLHYLNLIKKGSIKESDYPAWEQYCNQLFAEITGDRGTTFDISAIRGANTPKEQLKALLNKVAAGEIGLAIQEISSRLKRDITVENLYDLMASQRYSAGVRPEQLQRRLKAYGNEFKTEIESLPPSEAKLVYESCFHVKVY
jgi:hypothetical protein